MGFTKTGSANGGIPPRYSPVIEFAECTGMHPLGGPVRNETMGATRETGMCVVETIAVKGAAPIEDA